MGEHKGTNSVHASTVSYQIENSPSPEAAARTGGLYELRCDL